MNVMWTDLAALVPARVGQRRPPFTNQYQQLKQRGQLRLRARVDQGMQQGAGLVRGSWPSWAK